MGTWVGDNKAAEGCRTPRREAFADDFRVSKFIRRCSPVLQTKQAGCARRATRRGVRAGLRRFSLVCQKPANSLDQTNAHHPFLRPPEGSEIKGEGRRFA